MLDPLLLIRPRRGTGFFCGNSMEAWVIMKTIVNWTLLAAVASLAVVVSCLASAASGDNGWIDLIGKEGFEQWRSPSSGWKRAGDAELDPTNPKRQVAKAGEGVIMNGPAGRSRNLVTKHSFRDLEAHFEFKIPKDSNSGVKLEGFYEIQIHDSFGVEKPKASHAGESIRELRCCRHITTSTKARLPESTQPGKRASGRRSISSSGRHVSIRKARRSETHASIKWS